MRSTPRETGAYPLMLATYEIVCSIFDADCCHGRKVVLTVAANQGQASCPPGRLRRPAGRRWQRLLASV